MDTLLDQLWDFLVIGFTAVGDACFSLLSQLHFAGPTVLFFGLAAGTVLLTKVLNRVLITRRFVSLEKNYHQWLTLREQALQCEDGDKGRLLARNIDQAELNKAYYDYFFEGLLLGLARKVIPIYFVFAFLNTYYRQEYLQEYFGRPFVLRLPHPGGDPLLIGAVFWYFLCLLSCYLLWGLGGKWLHNRQSQAALPLAIAAGEQGM